MTRTTIRSEDISAGQVKSADLASDAVTPFDDAGLQTDIAILGFKVAANGSLAKYNLVDQTIDAFEDATGIDASASTNELRNASNYYSGGTAADPTGGTTTTYSSGGNDYKVHSFLSGATNFIVSESGTVDILLVAGGGAGHKEVTGASTGGGGAGGVRQLASTSVAVGTWVATVGEGGDGSVDPSTNGSNSTFILGGTTYSATGGGAGNDNYSPGDGEDGGSGGGASWGSGGAGNAGGYSPVEGYDGGDCATDGYSGAGGGGAGGVGETPTGTSGSSGGDGGVGVQNNYRTGSNIYYGGGGGGGSSTPGSGGNGGGGAGGYAGAGVAGSVNTGGGGGGAQYQNSQDGGDGGSGIIVIRYLADAFNVDNDMTLISNSTTAETQPTKADLVMTYTNGAGTASIGDGTNGDIRAFVSRDNGTTYTQFTLADEGDTGGHTILTAHDLDISGQPSGTSMLYKITTHNQSASKETRIQAVSLGWA
jgi:hypothetical protein